MRNISTKQFGTTFSVTVVPTLKDNFSYLIHDHATHALAAVDTNTDFKPILAYIDSHLAPQNGGANHYSRLSTILSTHKHWDHAGGNATLKSMLEAANAGTPVTVIGGANDNIPAVTKPVREGDHASIGELRVDVIDAPCHTSGHVLYKVYHPQHRDSGMALFTGDTMFLSGIGAFFEGNEKDMCRAMAKVYNVNREGDFALDAATFVFPGHEYTAGFMKFTAQYAPEKTGADRAFIEVQSAKYAAALQKGDPTVPSSLADEKRLNLFLRVADPAFVRAMQHGTAEELMLYLYNACD